MKLGKKCISLILALVMVLGLTVSASAAETETVTVQLSPNITVKLDGEVQTMTDVNGNPVYPVLYGGTTYLPIRAVGNMLGLDVDWDGATQTVTLEKSDGKATAATTGNKAPANAKPTEITVQINPNITVKYNGKAQAMTDIRGNPVYPMLYGGTTYLPVRAVSNMLGVKVDWDGDTQTVLLTSSETSGKEINIGTTDPDEIKSTLLAIKSMGVDDFDVDIADIDVDEVFNALMEFGVYTTANGVTIKYGEIDETADFNKRQTSANAKVLGEKHIGHDFAEIDWSHADDGYVSVKLNENLTKVTRCSVSWLGDNKMVQFLEYIIPHGNWVNIPLLAGSQEYVVDIAPTVTDADPDLTDEEWDIIESACLTARFKAEIADPEALWLLSHVKCDYENAPNACAKAAELTKNCKTDAEKITAIFEYVSKTISYDKALYNSEKARVKAGESQYSVSAERDLNPDSILENKKGVCEHYTALMAAMLRSQGIPCKVCIGSAYTGKSDNDGWGAHAWVAVKPGTGTLNMKALGAGKDFKPAELGEVVNSVPTGWIRLDPTWGHTSSGRAKAANDSSYSPDYCY